MRLRRGAFAAALIAALAIAPRVAHANSEHSPRES